MQFFLGCPASTRIVDKLSEVNLTPFVDRIYMSVTYCSNKCLHFPHLAPHHTHVIRAALNLNTRKLQLRPGERRFVVVVVVPSLPPWWVPIPHTCTLLRLKVTTLSCRNRCPLRLSQRWLLQFLLHTISKLTAHCRRTGVRGVPRSLPQWSLSEMGLLNVVYPIRGSPPTLSWTACWMLLPSLVTGICVGWSSTTPSLPFSPFHLRDPPSIM